MRKALLLLAALTLALTTAGAQTARSVLDQTAAKLKAAGGVKATFQATTFDGAEAGGADEAALSRYADYAAHLGSAFQIVDDILDVTSTAEELGKTPGKDERDGNGH